MRLKTSRLGYPTAFLALASLACAEPAEQVRFVLEEVQRYGIPDLGSGSLALEPAQAAGGVLGRVFGIVQGPDSTVYVLERDWRKIVAFNPDGSVRNVLLGGMGEGPGEFRLPVHLALLPGGGLAVLDYELRRVSLFDPVRGYSTSFTVDLPGPMRLAAQADRLWVSRHVGPSEHGVRAIAVDLDGNYLSETPPLPAEEIPFGSSVNIAVTPRGSLLLPFARPGRWELLAEGESEIRGVELVPGLEPPRVVRAGRVMNVESPVANTEAAAMMPDGRVLVWYRTGKNDQDGFWIRETIRDHFGLFSNEGAYLGPVTVPMDLALAPGGYLYASPLTGRVFVASTEPYPVVVELELIELGR